MPRSPDMPCSICGRMMWRGKGSLPEGQAVCHPCRRKSQPYLDRKRAAIPRGALEIRTCPECCADFEVGPPNQVYCTVGCRNRRRGRRGSGASTSERGYGREHQKVRAQWRMVVESGDADCCLCGLPIDPREQWHLDHTPDRDGYRGAAHALCNMIDGARRGAASTNAKRERIEHECQGCGSVFMSQYTRQVYCSPTCRPKRGPRVKVERPPRHCEDCGARVGQGKRCTACAKEHNRTVARNQYRERVGIPIDAPKWSRFFKNAS